MFVGSSRVLFALVFPGSACLLGAQTPAPSSRNRPAIAMDSARAAQLYVSNSMEDLPKGAYARQIATKKVTDSTYGARSAGVMAENGGRNQCVVMLNSLFNCFRLSPTSCVTASASS